MVNFLKMFEHTRNRFASAEDLTATATQTHTNSSPSSSSSIKESSSSSLSSSSEINNDNPKNKSIHSYQNYCKFRQASHSNNKYINKEYHLNNYLYHPNYIPHFSELRPNSCSTSSHSFNCEDDFLLNNDLTILNNNNSATNDHKNLSKELSSSIDSINSFKKINDKSFKCSTPCNYLSPKKCLSPCRFDSMLETLNDLQTLGVTVTNIISSSKADKVDTNNDVNQIATTNANANSTTTPTISSTQSTNSSISIMDEYLNAKNLVVSKSTRKPLKKTDSYLNRKTRSVCEEADELNKRRVNLSKHDEKIRENYCKLKKKINNLKQNNNNNNNNKCNSSNSNNISKCKLARKNSLKNNSCKNIIKNSTVLEKVVKVNKNEKEREEEEEEIDVDCRPIHIKIKLKRNSFSKNMTNKKEQSNENNLTNKPLKENYISNTSSSMDSFRKNIGQDEKKLIKFIYGQQYINDSFSNPLLPSSNRSSLISNNGTVKSNRVKFNDIIEMYDPGLKNRSSFSINDNMSPIKSLGMLLNENKQNNNMNGNSRSVSYQIPNGNINKLINKPIDRKDLKLTFGSNDIINQQNQKDPKQVAQEDLKLNKLINKSPIVPLPPTPPVHFNEPQPPLFSEQPKESDANSRIKKLSVATQTLNISFNKLTESNEQKLESEQPKNNDSSQENHQPQESTNSESEKVEPSNRLVKSKTAENVTNPKLCRADSFEQKLKFTETNPILSKSFKIDTLGFVDNKISFKRDEIDSSASTTLTAPTVIANPSSSKKPTPQLRRVVEIKTSTLPDFKYQQRPNQISNKNNSLDSCTKTTTSSESTNAINESLNTTRELEVNIEFKTNDCSTLSSQYSNLSGEKLTNSVENDKNNSNNNNNNTSDGSNDTLLFENNSSMNNYLDTTATRQEKLDAFKRRSFFRSGDHQYEQELNEIFKKMYDRHRSIQSSVSSDDNNSILSFRRSFSYTNSNSTTLHI